jgi:hypothetical protein
MSIGENHSFMNADYKCNEKRRQVSKDRFLCLVAVAVRCYLFSINFLICIIASIIVFRTLERLSGIYSIFYFCIFVFSFLILHSISRNINFFSVLFRWVHHPFIEWSGVLLSVACCLHVQVNGVWSECMHVWEGIACYVTL